MSHRHDNQDWQRPDHGQSDYGRHDGRDFDWNHGRSGDRDFDWRHDSDRAFGEDNDRGHHHHHHHHHDHHHRADHDRDGFRADDNSHGHHGWNGDGSYPDGPDRFHDGDGPRHGYGDSTQGHDEPTSGSGLQHAGDELGWNDAAFDDAGGFLAVLAGHLPADTFAGGDHGPVIFFINDLDIDLFNIINQNTIIQNTDISFDASNGGSIDVGGDLNAVAGQQAFLTEGPSDLSHLG
jgi:hypothetical protein